MKSVKSLLNKIIFTKKYGDSFISFLVYFLLALGLLFSTSASMDVSTTVKTTIISFTKQLIIIIISVASYHIVSHMFSFNFVEKYINKIVVAGFALLAGAVLWCSIYGAINGSYSWIYYGPVSLQPSEFAKIILVLLVATKFCDKSFKAVDTAKIFVNPLLAFVSYIAIVMFFQKDNGSAIIMGLIFVICFFVPQNKKLTNIKLIFLAAIVLAIAAYCFLLSEKGIEVLRTIGMTTFANRFEAVRNPSYGSDGTREIFYSLLGISKGNIFGVGLGDSVQKFGYLVSSNADYVFSIIVEETGLIGIVLVFVPYFLLIARLMSYAKRVPKESDKAILVGGTAYLFIHMTLNIGGVSGLVPLTGVPLLFLSSGGSATLSIMIMLGICQSVISKYNRKRDDIAPFKQTNE